MRRAVSFAAAFVAAGIVGTAVSAQAQAPTTRDWLDVGVSLDKDAIELRVDGDEPVTGLAELASVGAASDLAVRLSGGRLEVTLQDVSGNAGGPAWSARDTLVVGTPTSIAIVIDGKRYRGGAKVFVNPRGKITVANRVNVESYLRGVLPHELGRLDDGTLEAGKAQAVAARTYTLSYVGRRADEGFDLYDSVEDQVYGGTQSEGPITDLAVLETAGVVALYQGAFIRANYFSTCGGATANVEDIWPDPPFPWLRQVEDGSVTNAWCRNSPHYRWVERWTGAEVLADLNRYGPEQTGVSAPSGGWRQLRDLKVASRSPSGRVRELVYETDRGNVTVMADKTRWVLRRPDAAGGGILRSSLFKIGVKRDHHGRVVEVVASGGGNGHGAGMCQVGALAQARAGKSYAEILHFYYTGIDLVRM
jgi:stage II sporulation protein D